MSEQAIHSPANTLMHMDKIDNYMMGVVRLMASNSYLIYLIYNKYAEQMLLLLL